MISVLILLSVVVFCVQFWLLAIRPTSQASKLNVRFEKIEKGMTVARVLQIMGGAENFIKDEGFCTTWNDESLPPEEAEKIVKALVYPIDSSFFMFEISFDKNGKVVGKHFYD